MEATDIHRECVDCSNFLSSALVTCERTPHHADRRSWSLGPLFCAYALPGHSLLNNVGEASAVDRKHGQHRRIYRALDPLPMRGMWLLGSNLGSRYDRRYGMGVGYAVFSSPTMTTDFSGLE